MLYVNSFLCNDSQTIEFVSYDKFVITYMRTGYQQERMFYRVNENDLIDFYSIYHMDLDVMISFGDDLHILVKASINNLHKCFDDGIIDDPTNLNYFLMSWKYGLQVLKY